MIRKYVFIFLIWFPLFILVGSCNQSVKNERSVTDYTELEEPLLKANKQAVEAEQVQINNFIKRYKWQMQETGSGLRYAIYKKGGGSIAKPGNIAIMNYSVMLITGEEIYSSDKDGRKEFLIGKGGVESGLEEGILLLHVGDRAKFIIPSHLGFGLLGDQNKVPPKSTLIYDIELLDLK